MRNNTLQLVQIDGCFSAQCWISHLGNSYSVKRQSNPVIHVSVTGSNKKSSLVMSHQISEWVKFIWDNLALCAKFISPYSFPLADETNFNSDPSLLLTCKILSLVAAHPPEYESCSVRVSAVNSFVPFSNFHHLPCWSNNVMLYYWNWPFLPGLLLFGWDVACSITKVSSSCCCGCVVLCCLGTASNGDCAFWNNAAILLQMNSAVLKW